MLPYASRCWPRSGSTGPRPNSLLQPVRVLASVVSSRLPPRRGRSVPNGPLRRDWARYVSPMPLLLHPRAPGWSCLVSNHACGARPRGGREDPLQRIALCKKYQPIFPAFESIHRDSLPPSLVGPAPAPAKPTFLLLGSTRPALRLEVNGNGPCAPRSCGATSPKPRNHLLPAPAGKRTA